MKVYKKWLCSTFIIFALFFSSIMFVNLVGDPNAIFYKTHCGIKGIVPNSRYLKLDHILNNPERYDSFIFGSSRVGAIDPGKINGGTYYNVNYAAGLPHEHLLNIKALLDNDIEIKNIMIGFDDISYKINPVSHTKKTITILHYKADKKQKPLDFYRSYLMRIPTKNTFLSFKNRFNKFFNKDSYSEHEYHTIFNEKIFSSGFTYPFENIDEEFYRTEKHLKAPKFLKPSEFRGDNLEASLDDVREIMELSKRHGFNLVLFFNPLHNVTYKAQDMEKMFAFKSGLSKIGDYYDFSGLNRITIDNYYYLETSHYRHIVGEMIVKKIFNKTESSELIDFGFFVTKHNIEQHLMRLQKELEPKERN